MCSCANIITSDHLLRHKFVVGMKASPVRRALHEQISAISFHETMVNVVVWEQNDAEATVAMI